MFRDSSQHRFTRRSAILIPLLTVLFLVVWASSQSLAQHTPAGTTASIRGTGAGALLGGDLTDPDNNGLDAIGGAFDPSWNWVSIDASHEPDFEGGENAFNIFDNKVGGGNNKWCCDDPIEGFPVWVAVEFAQPVSLTHFTVTSGNDTPTRDPLDWAIQGSSDGFTYTDIYHYNASTNLWTARNQVVLFTLPSAATPYKFIRYIAYSTPAPLHQINEIEYFGLTAGAQFTLSPPTPNYRNLTFTAASTLTSTVNTNAITLTVDGQTVTPAISVLGGNVTIRYTPATPFALGSQHTYAIEVRDTAGQVVSGSGTVTIPSGFFPIPDLPSPTPQGTNWAVRFILSGGDPVSSLNVAMGLVTNNATAALVDVIAPEINYGAGAAGIFFPDNPYPDTATNNAFWIGDNFVVLGVYQLTITEEADYTFGVHSDDGFALRIRGGQVVSVSGNGTADPDNPEAVVHPGTTGDSNTRAVYRLAPGTYRVEFLFYEAGGGDHGELYWTRGAFTGDRSVGANWKLLGSGKPPTPILPLTGNITGPEIRDQWSIRWILGATDDFGTPLQINSAVRAMQVIRSVTNQVFFGSVVETTSPVINFVDGGGGGLIGGNLPIPDAVTSNPFWTTDDYVMLAVGHIQVPEAGEYTFGFHTDDGAGLRIIGGEVIRTSGGGGVDIGNTGAVVFPGTTGDSNTRAVYRLKKGIYRVEFFYFERGGGASGELYVAKGNFANDANTTTWALLGSPTGGQEFQVLGLDQAGLSVVSSDPGGDPLNTWAEAFFDLQSSAGQASNYTVANIGDPETNPGVQPFPKNTPADDQDYALRITGTLNVPQAGTYVVGFNTDDGGYLRINGQTFIEIQPGANAASVIQSSGATPDELFCDCLTGDANTFATITLAAGNYPFEAGMFERGGGSYIRLKGAAQGAPMASMPALSVNGAGTFTTPTSLGPLTTQPPAVQESTSLSISRSGGSLTISWAPAGGTLEMTTSLDNPNWTTVGTVNPATVTIGTGSAFYRVRN